MVVPRVDREASAAESEASRLLLQNVKSALLPCNILNTVVPDEQRHAVIIGLMALGWYIIKVISAQTARYRGQVSRSLPLRGGYKDKD